MISHKGHIHQVTQVKFTIKFSMFFLPGSPGFCLVLQTDGANEFQVLDDDTVVFLIQLRDLFQIDCTQ